MDSSKGIALYTDGSSNNRDRSGGWAFVALDAFGNEHQSSGSASDTTNNRMEQMAVLEGMVWVYEQCGPSEVLIFCDSAYVVKGCQDRKRKRKVNLDIWESLDAIVDLHDHVEFVHIRGHRGDHYNELADELAGAARKSGMS